MDASLSLYPYEFDREPTSLTGIHALSGSSI
jgi:hypothetical protein